MSFTLTLICNPKNPILTPALVAELDDIVPVSKAVWLAENVAADLPITHNPANLIDAVRARLAAKPIDVVIQPTAGREKRLLIADMDSTIIEQECLDELASFAGRKTEISAITQAAMRGELNFEDALRERVRMLKGMSAGHLQTTLRDCITFMPGGHTLVATMNKKGAMTALVSGGFTFFTRQVAQTIGFQDHRGNVLEIENGLLTGNVHPPILGQHAKLEALQAYCNRLALTPIDALAVGDGANDLAMLNAAGTGVAYRAKPAVAAAADHQINHADLTALLYLQGIPQSQFSNT